MLSYCKVQRNKIRFVVVQDLSRFARNNRDQRDAIFQLGLSDVVLRSTYESNIDEIAGGKLAANIFGPSTSSSPTLILRSNGTENDWSLLEDAFLGRRRSGTSTSTLKTDRT